MKLICLNQSLFFSVIDNLSNTSAIDLGKNDNQNKEYLKLKFDNLLITAHIGGFTKGSLY